MKIVAAIMAIAVALTGLATPALGQDSVVHKRTSSRSVSYQRPHHRRASYRRTSYRRAYVARARPRTFCTVRYRHGERYRICRTVYRRY